MEKRKVRFDKKSPPGNAYAAEAEEEEAHFAFAFVVTEVPVSSEASSSDKAPQPAQSPFDIPEKSRRSPSSDSGS